MAKLDKKGLAERKKIIEAFTKQVGKTQVNKWLKDSSKLSVINALAASAVRKKR